MRTIIRVKLPVERKMFCACKEGTKESCPVCRKEAGAFRILNKSVVEEAIAVVLSLGGALNQYTLFDRVKKDEKGYSLISQYSHPVAAGGKLVLSEEKEAELDVIRMEENENGMAELEILLKEQELMEEEEKLLSEKLEEIFAVLSIKEWKLSKKELPEQIQYLPDPSLAPVIISQWWTNQIAAKYPDLIHIEEPEMDEDDIF